MRIHAMLATLVFFVLPASGAQAQEQRLANYFFCELNDGKTQPDLIAFLGEYEKAVAEAGLDGYELRVQFPLYASEIGNGKFVWDGSWADFEAMAKISKWFRASEWPARFDALMTCERSSLWQVVD